MKIYCLLVCFEDQALRFQTPYAKMMVTGRIGNSVTFSWTIFDGVDPVTGDWRIKKHVDKISGRLVYLDRRSVDVLPPRLVPVAYRGRVN